MIQDFIVLLEILADKKILHSLLINLVGNRVHRPYQTLVVREMFVQEVKNHIPTCGRIVGIHGHLAKKISYLRIYYRESS